MATGGAMTSVLHMGGGVEGGIDGCRKSDQISYMRQEGKFNAKKERPRKCCCASMNCMISPFWLL